MKKEHQNRHHRTGGQSRIHPVEHAAMSGYEAAGILDPEAALDEALEQIASMGGRAEEEGKQNGNAQRSAQEQDVKAKDESSGEAAANGAGPSLGRRQFGGHARPSDEIAEYQGACIRRPHDQK